VEATRQQKTPPVKEKYFPKSNGAFAVALRWSTTPNLGFPREPFQVFRRQRDNAAEKTLYEQALTSPVTISGDANVPFFTGDYAYVVRASVTVPSGSSLILSAMDSAFRVIPGQTITFSANGLAEFRTPGIAGLHAAGTGTINGIAVIEENKYANLPDWQKIQTVGLPLKDKEIGPAYNTLPQGFEPPTLDGVTASVLRTTITALLQLNPPPTGVADFPLPAWPVPDPPSYVNQLRSGSSLMPMIERCLKTSVDSDATKTQSLYTETVHLEGIKQANLPGATADPSRPSQATLPITGVSMMSVSTDSFAAVSLGYGTVDIPPSPQGAAADVPGAVAIIVQNPTMPPGVGYGGWDYMVTAPFVFPFGLSVTLAALSAGQLPVEAPVGMTAAVKQVQSPIHRNEAAPASITVSWQPSSMPQGYGILVSRAPNQSMVLNSSRPPVVKGFDPYVALAPLNPDPNTPPMLQLPNFCDTLAMLPLKNPPNNNRYLVAGLDVFGQWSPWSSAFASLSPAPITKPGIRNVEFIMDAAHAAGHIVPATLRIEFAWDWTDRAPGSLRFTGKFVAPPGQLGPIAYTAGLATQQTGPVGPPLVLTFNYTATGPADTMLPNWPPPTATPPPYPLPVPTPQPWVPAVTSGHTLAEPITIIQSKGADPKAQQTLYRIDISGFSLDFTSVNEIDFALYATASEEIRPGEWSDIADPVSKFIGKVAKAHDPIPPPVTFTPPSISWTALPDATGKARGILEWTADPKAAGYYVWEATESALLHILSPGAADPSPSTPLVTRGGNLKTLVLANQDKSLQGFARLNKDPIVGSRTEIVVPASASTLYVYRVSAISAAKVEAARSPQIAVFGVPRRNVPGDPRLMLRRSTSPQGIQVIGLPVESGPVPAGYRVFRVRNEALSHDGSTMGPAKLSDTNAGWQPYAGTTLQGKPVTGKSIVDTAAIPSWFPWYYRITAIGVDDPNNGLLRGESGYSGVQSAFTTPSGPPLIQSPILKTNINGALVTLTTDLPAAGVSPIGPALVEVLHLIPDPANPGKMTTKTILSAAPNAILVGTLALPVVTFPPPHFPPHLPPPHPPLPLPHKPPPPTPALRRSAPDSSEHFKLYVLIPWSAAQKDTFLIRLTDPLARQSVYSF
jgi:hypothetical protein